MSHRQSDESGFGSGLASGLPAQFRSLDGIVFWSPLSSVYRGPRPRQFCSAPTRAAWFQVLSKGPRPYPTRRGHTQLVLQDREPA